MGKVHENRSFTVVGDRIFNLGLLSTKKQKTIGQKRPLTLEIIDTIRILGVQNQNVNFINPITVSISSDTVIQQLTKYKKHRYRFVLESLLFTSCFESDTEVIFVSSEGLSNVKEAHINSKLHNVLGVCYLSELKDWAEIKGQSKRSQAIFVNSEQQQKTTHLAFAFTTWSIFDLLNFTVILLDGNRNKLAFPDNV